MCSKRVPEIKPQSFEHSSSTRNNATDSLRNCNCFINSRALETRIGLGVGENDYCIAVLNLVRCQLPI